MPRHHTVEIPSDMEHEADLWLITNGVKAYHGGIRLIACDGQRGSRVYNEVTIYDLTNLEDATWFSLAMLPP